MLKQLLLLTAAAATALAMHTGEVNINNEDIEAELKFDMGQFNSQLDVDSIYIGGRYIYADKKSDADELIEISYVMQKPLQKMPDLRIGIGFKLNYSSADSYDFVSLPLGLEARYRLPFETIVPLYIGSKLYYAPSVLSFSDADSYFEWKANLDIEVIERGLITLGYRYINTDYEVADVAFNRAAFIGFKFVF